jgi:TonB family protein
MDDVKLGVSGKLVLSVALDAEASVKEIHVVQSLSPHLDEAALKAVRTWKFKLIDGNSGDSPNDFRVHIIFRAICPPRCYPFDEGFSESLRQVAGVMID